MVRKTYRRIQKEYQSEPDMRQVREERREQSQTPGSRCMTLLTQLDETRRRHLICRHLLGRAHLL